MPGNTQRRRGRGQGATTSEISRNVQQAANGTAGVAANISNVNRGAGEAGRGFAIVASDVRARAGRTAEATEKIVAQVVGTPAATSRSVNAIKEIRYAAAPFLERSSRHIISPRLYFITVMKFTLAYNDTARLIIPFVR